MSTPPEDGELTLAADFPAATPAQWRELVAGVLRKAGAMENGDSADAAPERLATETYDGILVDPLYTRENATRDGSPPAVGLPGLAPFVRGDRAAGHVASGWDLRQRHVHPDPTAAREAIRGDLENGVTSIWLRIGDGGLSPGELGRSLEGVDVGLVPVALDPGADVEGAAAALLELHAERGTPADAVRGNLGADPIGLLARTGEDQDPGPAVALARRCAEGYPALRALVADGLPYHRAGGSDAEELAMTLAVGVADLRLLVDGGLSLDDALGQIEFRYAATADQFQTIAKLRAARRLWSRVGEVLGDDPGSGAGAQVQHAVTSPAMMTRRDPWTNMLRTTVACFGAGVGGADAVTVLPFDAAIGVSDAFARRIARNTQSLLIAESHVAGVIDPAGGSWYVERLSDELARVAWAWFREIEAAGGAADALRSGQVAERLERTWERRREAIARRRDAITGVSEFADPDEPRVERPPLPPEPTGGLPRRRHAEPFEALRDRADAHEKANGARPRVFLATIGPVARHNARAGFAANLFRAGGIETTTAGPTEGPGDVVRAFGGDGATVACLCGSDGGYAEQAEDVARGLREAGAADVLLAGDPGERRGAYAEAGVGGFVYTGCDALEALGRTFDALGVA